MKLSSLSLPVSICHMTRANTSIASHALAPVRRSQKYCDLSNVTEAGSCVLQQLKSHLPLQRIQTPTNLPNPLKEIHKRSFDFLRLPVFDVFFFRFKTVLLAVQQAKNNESNQRPHHPARPKTPQLSADLDPVAAPELCQEPESTGAAA